MKNKLSNGNDGNKMSGLKEKTDLLCPISHERFQYPAGGIM
jgi:hypothetical protein